MKENSKVRKIAFIGDHLPRKCGIATFTSDLLAAVATAYPQSQSFSVSVNDIRGGYEYPEVVRFEIEEQDLPSYLRAADFLNIGNLDLVCLEHEFGISVDPPAVTSWPSWHKSPCCRSGWGDSAAVFQFKGLFDLVQSAS